MWLHRSVIALAAYALFAGGLATFSIVEQQEGRSAVEDAPRALLSSGGIAPAAPQAAKVDLAHYLGTFWVRYDADGSPTAGNGYLHGELAQVPRGVLHTAVATGEDAVTWQPEPGLRFAVVAQPAGDGVMLAGQSLHRTEQRADRALRYVALAAVAGAVVVGIAVAADVILTPRRRPGASAPRDA